MGPVDHSAVLERQRAFTTETEAQTYVTHLDEMVRVLEVWEQESGLSVYHTSKIDAPGRPSTALDPQFSKDYTGTKYRYEAVPLALEAP
jgi:hypothetical protein